MKINFCIFLVICGASLSLAEPDGGPYCYNLTWISTTNADPEKHNCRNWTNTPCIKDPIISDELPDLTEIWKASDNKHKERLCAITSGNVCIKYTFLYNTDIVNITMFCGKVTEDEYIPVTSGCYQQKKDGYILEICACRTRGGKEPCNMSVQATHSNILITTVLLFTIMKFIY